MVRNDCVDTTHTDIQCLSYLGYVYMAVPFYDFPNVLDVVSVARLFSLCVALVLNRLATTQIFFGPEQSVVADLCFEFK